MKIGIVGYGVEGKSAEAYFEAHGHDVTILDTEKDLTGYDLLVRSPGVHPDKLPANADVTSVTNEFLAHCPAPIFGVTGTKGKGTTATLLAKMLETTGKKVWLGGNIGVPALDFLDQVTADDLVVLELSSFQLMDAQKSPHVAICLMIAPEHLDYHADEAEYVAAKGNIFRYQKPDDVAVYNANDSHSRDLVKLSAANQKLPYDTQGSDQSGAYVLDGAISMQGVKVCATSDVALVGEHNLQNVCAALAAAWHETQDQTALAEVIGSFTGLPYRLEEIAVKHGVRFINDSISTTPESTIAALRAFAAPKLLILGGSSKGAAYDQLAHEIGNSQVRAVALLGDEADKIKQALEAQGYAGDIVMARTMAEAVGLLADQTQSGDVVLLSPACASFGTFKNYKDRGDQFTAAVSTL